VVTVNLRDANPPRAEVVVAEDRERTELEIRLPGASLTVRVIDTHGRPVQDAFVDVGRAGWHTGPDGRAVIKSLPAVETRVLVGRMVGATWVDEPVRRVVPADHEITFRVVALAEVSGIVRAPDGASLPGVLVHVESGNGSKALTFTGPDGSFSSHLLEGRTVKLVVDGRRFMVSPLGASGWLPVWGECEATAPAKGLVIRTESLEANRSLEVLVLDLDGQPVPGARVTARARRRLHQQETDAHGTALLTAMRPTEVRVQVYPRWPGDPPAGIMHPEAVRVRPGGQRIVMQYRRGVMIEGRVLSKKGEAVKGALVCITTRDGYKFQTTSGEDGAFRLPAVPGATHDMYANPSGRAYRMQRAELEGVRPEDGQVILRLAPW
jgi:Carboxypeptidase regulatory-like domain